VNKGQGIIESIFALGILGIILSGVVILIIMTLSNKKNSFDRERATELGTIVMEELVSQSQDDEGNFWKLNGSIGNTRGGYEGYVYNIGVTNITTNGCGVGVTNCAEVVVGVGYSGKTPQTVYFNRFFSRQ
jgi:Tfp pilus assembly protein PilV